MTTLDIYMMLLENDQEAIMLLLTDLSTVTGHLEPKVSCLQCLLIYFKTWENSNNVFFFIKVRVNNEPLFFIKFEESNKTRAKLILFKWMIKNLILKKKMFCRLNCFMISLFQPLVKSENECQTFQIHVKQQKCTIKGLNVPNFCDFFLK